MVEKGGLFPFELTPGTLAAGVADLAAAVIEESDRQVAEKALQDEDLSDEFRMACDGLGCWRMFLRLLEEAKLETADVDTERIFRELCRLVAVRRQYEQDDFQSALGATQDRARLPWGYNSLRLAYGRAQRNPLRLLHPDLENAPLPTLIAGIAYELAQMQESKDPILLPVDNLRALLGHRKLVVGGALQRLMQAGIVEQTSKRHGTGRAREFKFCGVEGKDFVFAKDQGGAKSAKDD